MTFPKPGELVLAHVHPCKTPTGTRINLSNDIPWFCVDGPCGREAGEGGRGGEDKLERGRRE